MKLIRNQSAFFVLIVVIGMIGVAGALRQGISINTVKDSAHDILYPSQNVFRDTEFGISFRYPKNWKERFVSPDIILFSPEDGGVTMTLVLKKRKEAETLSEFRDKNIQEIQESAASVGRTIDLDMVREGALGTIPAMRRTYHTNQEGLPVDGVQVWAVQDKKEYILTFAARKDVFSTAVQTFDSVLQSLQIQ